MKRQRMTAAVPLACLMLVGGCPTSVPSVSDPPSNAPELAGRWCLSGDEQGFVGYFELDETGDPTTLKDNPLVSDELGENALILDGARHGTNSGVEYTGIASAALNGTDAEFFVEIHVFSFGFEMGALALKFEGERTTADTIEGVTVTLQDFPGQNAPDMRIEAASARKNACD